jgi:hypothetical protein
VGRAAIRTSVNAVALKALAKRLPISSEAEEGMRIPIPDAVFSIPNALEGQEVPLVWDPVTKLYVPNVVETTMKRSMSVKEYMKWLVLMK